MTITDAMVEADLTASRERLIMLLHNCAAEYQKDTIAKLHYSHLQRAASELVTLMRENEALRAEAKTNKLALEMCSNECNKLHEDYDKKMSENEALRARIEDQFEAKDRAEVVDELRKAGRLK